MKKFLLGLLVCFCASAQVSDINVIQDFKKELMSEKSKDSEELQKVLEKYFNDGCKVVVNGEKIVLKKERFPQYAKIGAAFLSKIKKDYEFEVPKNISNDDGKNNEKSDNRKSEQSVFLNISEKQRVRIDFVLENKKFSEVRLKDIPLSKSQSLVLRGVFNLLK